MDLALFDFDGTITTRELLPDFVRFAVPPSRLLFGQVALAPLVAGYRLGIVSGTTLRSAIARVGFGGTPLGRYRAAGRKFARDVIPGALRPRAMQRIAWHKARGDTIAVVSGAFDVYLQHWCDAHELAVVCSSLEHRDGVLTGRYAGRQCVLGEKARLVRERFDLPGYRQVFAYGDTAEDRDLLGLADQSTTAGSK